MAFLKSLRYSLYIIFHPFDGFWDLKREGRGSLWAAHLLVALTILVSVAQKLNTAVIFNDYFGETISLLMEAASVLFLLCLWCSVNWCVTTLLDGEGTFRDIYMYSAYALTPYILLQTLQIFLSHFLSFDEAGLLTVISALSAIWVVGLFFFGTLVTHDFSLGKTVGVVILILASIVVVLFVGLLLVYVIQQMWNFIQTIYTETVIRR